MTVVPKLILPRGLGLSVDNLLLVHLQIYNTQNETKSQVISARNHIIQYRVLVMEMT